MQLIGQNTSLKKIIESVNNVLKLKSFQLLITGETGTGKSALIQHVFALTKKQNLSLIEINCLEEITFPENFADCLVYFSAVEYLNKADQKKLLTLLQSPKKPPLLFSAEQNSLAARLRSGEFSQELADRLSLVQVELPPLRERKNELETFVVYFIYQAARKYAKNVENISRSSLEKLATYSFPGNISELKTIIQHAVLLEETKTIQPDNILLKEKTEQLNAGNLDQPFSAYKKEAVRKIETLYLEHALRQTKGSVTKASEKAKLLRPAFSRLLRRNKISQRTFK